MFKIKQILQRETGEIVFENENGEWFEQKYNEYDPMASTESKLNSVVVEKIEKPL